MIFLLLNVIFASSFTLIIKWVQTRKREDVITVGAINYIAGWLFVLPGFMRNDVSEVSPSAIATGATMGACYFIAFFFVIHTIRWIGAASATVVGVLSITVPITCGIFIWNETPTGAQFIGVLFALCALTLIGTDRSNRAAEAKPWFVTWVLVAFFALAGISRLAQDAFKHTSVAEQRPTYLFTAFLVASIPSVALLVYRRKRITLTELGFGLMMGAANILQTHFILRALEHFSGFIVFPVTSAGGLILTTIVATRMLGERLHGKTYAGIAIAVVALVLLNWEPPIS